MLPISLTMDRELAFYMYNNNKSQRLKKMNLVNKLNAMLCVQLVNWEASAQYVKSVMP